MTARKISEHDAGSPVTKDDRLLVNQGEGDGTTVLVEVGDLDGLLDPAAHEHVIGDVDGLQSALDGKAPADHNHDAAAIVSGLINPAVLGTGADPETKFLRGDNTWQTVGGGAAGFNSQRAATETGSVTSTDANGVIYIDGSGITLTFERSGFQARDTVTLINIGTAAATISAGTDGFNEADNDEFTLFPGEERIVVYEGSADPYWRTAIPDMVQLAANQFAALNSAGTALEARTEKVVATVFLPVTGNVSGGAAEGQIGMWGNKPVTLTGVRARTLGGTCSIQIRKNGTAINGFGDAVAQTTSPTNTASTETLAQDNVLDVVVTSASALTGVFITILGARTAN